MRPTSIYDGKAHSVLLLRAPVEKSRPAALQPVGALMITLVRVLGLYALSTIWDF
jgi:hypothetical protein